MRKYLLSFILLSFIVCSEALAGGGSKTTELKGKITDRFGEPLIGAQIKISSTNQEVYTDFEGSFVIDQLPVSEQELKISHISHVDKTVVIDLTSQTESQLQLQLSSK